MFVINTVVLVRLLVLLVPQNKVGAALNAHRAESARHHELDELAVVAHGETPVRSLAACADAGVKPGADHLIAGRAWQKAGFELARLASDADDDVELCHLRMKKGWEKKGWDLAEKKWELRDGGSARARARRALSGVRWAWCARGEAPGAREWGHLQAGTRGEKNDGKIRTTKNKSNCRRICRQHDSTRSNKRGRGVAGQPSILTELFKLMTLGVAS